MPVQDERGMPESPDDTDKQRRGQESFTLELLHQESPPGNLLPKREQPVDGGAGE